MRYRYYTADVFTDRIFGGNPLAVFPDAEGLSPEQMQRVARELNLSETVFVRPPKEAANSRHLRIFTPSMELPFAGHPTLGCAHVLALLGEIEARSGETEVIFEEGIGPITVRIQADGGTPGFTQLDVARMPEFAMEIPSLRSIASALSLDISDLLLGDDRPVAVSCGVPFLVVPLRSLAALGRARLDRETWESSLQDTWAPNLYAFVYDAETEGADMRARVFAPALGIEEDPATGAGAASLAGYLCSLDAEGQGSRFWTLEQGFEMGRPSLIKLEADMEQSKVIAIRIGGASVLVGEAWIEVPRPGEHGGLVLEAADRNQAPIQTKADPKADARTDSAVEPTTQDTAETKDAATTEPEAEPEPEAKAEPTPKPEAKAEPEAGPAVTPEPVKKPEAKAEPAKAVAGAPAMAGGDKVVPLRAVFEALRAKKTETSSTAEDRAKPEPVSNKAAEAPVAGPVRRIGLVVDPPDPEEVKPKGSAATPTAEAEGAGEDDARVVFDVVPDQAANGRDHAPPASMAALAREAEPPSEEDEDDLENEAKHVDDDGLIWDDAPEDEDEAVDEEDWDDDEDDAGDDGGLDEDLRRFRRQEHYKFLWSATLRHREQIYACVIIDLSPKAALVQLEEELAYDLTLKFDSPVILKNDKIGRLKGEVAWRDKNRLGVELLEDPEEVSKILDAARG
ncbi:MAG: PhzF family phenazine biosynthesis isomerase [Kiloniellales bacterium]|nr:PhzF family phenazine biosynthesis isomerase [Kiloniellales bacterium]